MNRHRVAIVSNKVDAILKNQLPQLPYDAMIPDHETAQVSP